MGAIVWSQIPSATNAATQKWKQNSGMNWLFSAAAANRNSRDEFSQLLSTSQINCHKGSEVALALPPVWAGRVRYDGQ